MALIDDPLLLGMAKEYGAESDHFKLFCSDDRSQKFVKELKEHLIKRFGKDSDEYSEYFPKKKNKYK